MRQQMHICKYVQSQVSVTPVTIIRTSYNKTTINIQIIVQNIQQNHSVIFDIHKLILWS